MNYLQIVDGVVINSVNADVPFIKAWASTTQGASYINAVTAPGVGIDWEVVAPNSYKSPEGNTLVNGVFTYLVETEPYVPPVIPEVPVTPVE